MRKIWMAGALALLGATGAVAQSSPSTADRLAGSWRPVRIGTLPVPASADARLYFYGGAHYNTQAGCGNFEGDYSLDGARIRTRQRDPIVLTKCPNRASARIESALGGLIAQASTYDLRPDGSLRILARDGRIGLFRRPVPILPALQGEWSIERIGRDSVAPARRATMKFEDDWVSAGADCNRYGAKIARIGTGFYLSGGAATEMGCGPEREAFDRRLFAAVGKARYFRLLPDGRISLQGGEALLLRRR